MQQLDGVVEKLLSEILQLSPASITEDLKMKDVEAWDSLKHMEIVVAVEQRFDFQLTFDEIVAMQSVGDIKRVLREKGLD